MNPQAIKYVLWVQNMDRAVAFYRDTMGLEEGFASPDWSELRFGGAIIGLHSGGDGSRKQTRLSIQCEDVTPAFAAAIEAGAQAVQSPARREGEPIILSTIADPEGNVIMLTQYVGEG